MIPFHSLSASARILAFGACACIFSGAISSKALAQDAGAGTVQAAAPAVVVSDCVSTPVVRLAALPALDETRLVELPGNVHPLARAEFDRGPVADDLKMEHIMMVLRRTPEQEKALALRVDQMHNRRSPLFHQWLSAERVGACYGVADEDIAQVNRWLESKGFTIDNVPAGKTMIIFTGTAGQVRDAFHTEIHNLEVRGEHHIANMSTPQVPAALAPVIAGFRSLHNFFPRPSLYRKKAAKRDPLTGKLLENGPGRLHPPAGVSADGRPRPDLTFTDTGTTDVSPQDFYTIYNETPLLNGTACNGKACDGNGQTIAVIEETDVCAGQTGTTPDNCNGANDLVTFRKQFRVNFGYADVYYRFGLQGYCSDPGVQGPHGTDEESEADLDLQWAGVVAPEAAEMFIACASTNSTAGVDLAATYAVNGYSSLISSFSESYSDCEANMPPNGTGSGSFYTMLWEQAAAEGQTVVVSAGDSGDDVCDRGDTDGSSGYTVNGLASTAYNVAAGGTDFSDNYSSGNGSFTAGGPYWNTTDSLPFGSALSYIPETTWNQTCGSVMWASFLSDYYSATYTPEQVCNGDTPIGTDSTFVNASGSGGYSVNNPLPTWQSAYGVGLASNYTSTTRRNLPDISLFASAGFWRHNLVFCESDKGNGTGGSLACDYTNENDTDQLEEGGTSFVAPQLAGMMALINQAWPSGNPGRPTRQGQANYTLYALASHEYGTPSAENTSTTAPSVLTCESNYLSLAAYSSVAPSCVFHNINRTPLIETNTCTGSNDTNCLVDGNEMPCATGFSDCYTATGGDAYGLLSISTTSFEPAWYQSAGFSDAVGLGSVNITNLVSNWTSSTWLTPFASTTTLSVNVGTISQSGSLTVKATVTATGRGSVAPPAGDVEFFLNSTSGTLLRDVVITPNCGGSAPSESCDGTAAFSLPGSALQVGSNNIVAYFEGDGANDAPSISQVVTVNVRVPAAMETPAPSSVLTGSSVTFTWSTGTGATQYQLWLGTMGVGSNNLYSSGAVSATSATVNTLPLNGEQVFARLFTNFNGTWLSVDYLYTASKPAAMTSPAPSSILGGPNVTFQWSAGTGTNYELWLGSTGVNSNNLYSSGIITATTAAVHNLPINGEKIYARLFTEISGVWTSINYTYTAGSPAVLQTPATGSALAGPSVTFSWSAGGGATGYQLWLGLTGVDSNNLYSSGDITATTATVNNLPANGGLIYARLFTNFNGTWTSINYTYTAATGAVLGSPTPGGPLAGPSVQFAWFAGIGATGYQLWVGSTGVGSNNLYSSGVITATSATATSLLTNGATLYVRLYTELSGAWSHADYTYTAATAPALTSPAPGSTLTGSSATFIWTTGGGASGYQLLLGSTLGGDDLYGSGVGLSNAIVLTNLPVDGRKIYVRLYIVVNGVYNHEDYTLTAYQASALTSPAPSSTLSSPSVAFQWTPGAGTTQYQLWLGTSVNANNLYSSGIITTTSATVSNLPLNGEKIYVRLFSYQPSTGWYSSNYTVTAATEAMMQTPAAGSTLSGSSVTFTWLPGTGATQYQLWLGSTGVGSNNLYSSGAIDTTSVTVNNLPSNGETIYARLFTNLNGTWVSVNFTYMAAP